MEDHKVDAVPHNRQRRRRQSQLKLVHHHCGTAHRIARCQVARTRIIDAKAAMGLRAAGIHPFRQRNRVAGSILRCVLRCAGVVRLPNGLRRSVLCTSKDVLKPNSQIARKRKRMGRIPEVVVAGMRQIQTIEIRRRPKNAVREKLLRRKVLTPRSIQWARITCVMEVRQARPTHTHRLRELRNQRRGNLKRVLIHIDQTILVVIDQVVSALHLLCHADVKLRRLRLECRDVLNVGIAARNSSRKVRPPQ